MSLSAACFLQAQDVSVITNTMDVYGNSVMKGNAKFDAMAGANGALGGDANSLLTNPAGLGVAISGEVSLSLNIHNYENKTTLGGKSLSYDNDVTDISNVSGVAAFRIADKDTDWKFANLGVSYSNRSLDNYIETPVNKNISFTKSLIDTNNNPVTGNLGFQGHAYNRTGDLSKLSIGLGANYDNRFYLGAGLNFSNSRLEQYDTTALSLDLDNTTYSFNKQYTPYLEDATGFSATFGLIGKISKTLRLGLALQTPTWWTMDRTYNNYQINTNGDVVSDTFTEDRKLRTPFKTTLSAAIVPTKNFAINVDYTVGLTKPKYKEQGAAERELNQFFNDNAKNTSEIRVGAEYRYKGLRLRGGYAYANSPFEPLSISSVNLSGNNMNQPFMADRNIIGVGIGYQFSSFFIDAAYQNVSSSTYQNPMMQGFENYGTGYYSNDFDVTSDKAVVSEVENKQRNVTIGIGWKF